MIFHTDIYKRDDPFRNKEFLVEPSYVKHFLDMCSQNIFSYNFLLKISLFIIIELIIKNNSLPTDDNMLQQSQKIRNTLNANLMDDDSLFGTFSPKSFNTANDIENSSNNVETYPKETDNSNTLDSNEEQPLIPNEIKNDDLIGMPPKMIESLLDFKAMNIEKNDKSLVNWCLSSRTHVNDACLMIHSANKNNGFYNPFVYHRCVKLLSLLDFYHCINQNKQEKYMNDGGNNNNINDKRVTFHAWGGKRFRQGVTEKIQSSKVPFNAWGGKRHMEQVDMDGGGGGDDFCKRSKSKFHSWGGKRNY